MQLNLDLRVDFADEAVVGQLALAGGESQGFVGYAGLIAALESIRNGERAVSSRDTADQIGELPSGPAPKGSR